ncbi:MAG: multiheme c-type cytochrome [Polyangiaceae bacterium]
MKRIQKSRQTRASRTILVWGLGLTSLHGCGAGPRAREASGLSSEGAPAVLTPGSNPARGSAAVAKNDTCESCHTEISREWRSSLHRQAFVEPAYQRALQREPLPFCRGCHAPEADAASPPSRELAELGVGCVTCHVVEGRILAGGKGPAPDAHPVFRALSLTPAGACQSCHEFEFPDRALRERPLLMQSTVSEHAASSMAGTTCASCHMERAADGHLRHDFQSSRDVERLRRAVHVEVARRDGGRVVLTLEARGVGHALPTGDLFRRLEIGAELIGDDYRVLKRDHRYLTRHFRIANLGSFAQRQLVRDDRLLEGQPRRVELELVHPESSSRPIAWWVAYHRVAFPRANKEDAEIEQELLLASGTLPPAN